MKWLLAIGLLLIASVAYSAEPVGVKLQATSVNIKAGMSQGSGTVVLRDVDKTKTAFVVTAAHVIDGLRKVNEVIVAGNKKQSVTYLDAQIVQEVSTGDGSRTVGDTRLDAKVLTVDYSRDIAILQVRSLGTLKASAEFFSGKMVPSVGTEIYHCAAPGGQDVGGTATLTAGIISRTGVRIPEFGGSDKGIFDQTDTASMGGSSGGMLCLRANGQWIGMITLGLNGAGGFAWFVPVRSLREMCDPIKCGWLLDGGSVDGKDLEALPIEVSPPNLSKAPTPAQRTLSRAIL